MIKATRGVTRHGARQRFERLVTDWLARSGARALRTDPAIVCRATYREDVGAGARGGGGSARRTARTSRLGGGAQGSRSCGIPRIRRRGVADEVGDVRDPQLVGRPAVQLGEAWHDDAQVEEPADGVLVGDVVVELTLQRIEVRQHPRHREEHAGHVQPRIAEPSGDRREPGQREPGRGDEGVGVQHADQDEVDEEALDPVLALGQVAVVEVRADDRDVVGQVPRARRRLTGEADRRLDAGRRRRTRVAEEAQARLAGVAQQSFVHRPPPRAARTLMIERVEEATPQLPAHERQRRASIPEMQRRGTRRWRVRRPEQLQPALRTVADLGDALRGDRRRRDATRRLTEHLDAAARITHAVSIAASKRSVRPTKVTAGAPTGQSRLIGTRVITAVAVDAAGGRWRGGRVDRGLRAISRSAYVEVLGSSSVKSVAIHREAPRSSSAGRSLTLE